MVSWKGEFSMDELTKIDLLRERTGASYKEAKEALDQVDGDVVLALVNLEKEQINIDDDLKEKSNKVLNQVKEIIKKGNVNRIKIKRGNKTVADLPVNMGALGLAGVVLSPTLAVIGALGTVAALANDYTLEIERTDGEIEIRNLEIGDDQETD